MTTKRKVRKDFDLSKRYNVDVSECTIEDKKEVQQAFLDAGFQWMSVGKDHEDHKHLYDLYAMQYTNTINDENTATRYLFWSIYTEKCNMTAKEFLELVYEPENLGHVHAELMALYAEDAKTHAEPWKLWELKVKGSDKWFPVGTMIWDVNTEYRRKPKTKLIHGVEIPVFEFTPKVGERFYVANVGLPEFFEEGYRSLKDCTFTQRMIERGLLYPYTEEGKQSAILHAKAMLGMEYVQESLISSGLEKDGEVN